MVSSRSRKPSPGQPQLRKLQSEIDELSAGLEGIPANLDELIATAEADIEALEVEIADLQAQIDAEEVYEEPAEPIAVAPAAPVFYTPAASDPASCTIAPFATIVPTEGVEYSVTVDGLELTANELGQYTYEYGKTIVVTATVLEGYILEEGAQTEWSWTAPVLEHCDDEIIEDEGDEIDPPVIDEEDHVPPVIEEEEEEEVTPGNGNEGEDGQAPVDGGQKAVAPIVDKGNTGNGAAPVEKGGQAGPVLQNTGASVSTGVAASVMALLSGLGLVAASRKKGTHSA